MSERAIVIVSRNNKEYEIRHRVVYPVGAIRIESDLDEFVQAVCYEVLPKFLRKRLEKRVKAAVKRVVEDMKGSTIHAPPPRVIKDGQ